MVNLDKFKKKLSGLVLKRIEELIQEKIEDCDQERMKVDIVKEDKETTIYMFSDINENWNEILKFTLVIYKVEDVDVCCDDKIITFNINTPLAESFKKFEDLLGEKISNVWRTKNYVYKEN